MRSSPRDQQFSSSTLNSIFVWMLNVYILLIASQAYSQVEHQQDRAPSLAISELLQQPQTKYFRVSRVAPGKWTAGHSESYYAAQISYQFPVFTVANGSVVAAVTPVGVLKEVCVFGETERKLPSFKGFPSKLPGGWVTWERKIAGPLDFKIESSGTTNQPSANWPCQTAYLLNALPVTTYDSEALRVSTVTCPPISRDGEQRPRALLWGICVQNISPTAQTGAVLLSAAANLMVENAAGKSVAGGRIEFALKPGETFWLSLAVAPTGNGAALREIRQRPAVEWLRDTCAYWQKVTGQFSMPNDPFTAELFQRLTILSLESAALDQKGGVAGTLYGTYPLDGLDNFRDSYYAILPAAQRDPALMRRIIPWFAEYSVRPVSDRYPRGVSHSLGNSLNGVVLAGRYYDATGDREYFSGNPELMKRLGAILEKVLVSRKADGPWLFPSSYISDGYSVGDYHTGSNVCAWYAFHSFARILKEAGGDATTAARYQDVANRIKADLDKHNIIAGPFGPQYIEGRDADGSVPAMIHDGEESDTALMPFYGYLAADAAAYQNYMRCAASPHNGSYQPETRGIVWENYGPGARVKPVGGHAADATFPGYVTALAGCTDAESLRGKDGYLTELRRLTDVNGSWWWWPYKKGWKRSHVQRAPFECGWAEGTFGAVFPANFLGLDYDAPTHTLRFNPLTATGAFMWKNFPIGNDRFTVVCELPSRVVVENHNSHGVRLEAMLIAGNVNTVTLNGKPVANFERIRYFGSDAVRVTSEIAPGERVELKTQLDK
jgi:hypothetical protein